MSCSCFSLCYEIMQTACECNVNYQQVLNSMVYQEFWAMGVYIYFFKKSGWLRVSLREININSVGVSYIHEFQKLLQLGQLGVRHISMSQARTSAEKQVADYSKLKAKQEKFQVSCRIWKDMYFMLNWNLFLRSEYTFYPYWSVTKC